MSRLILDLNKLTKEMNITDLFSSLVMGCPRMNLQKLTTFLREGRCRGKRLTASVIVFHMLSWRKGDNVKYSQGEYLNGQ